MNDSTFAFQSRRKLQVSKYLRQQRDCNVEETLSKQFKDAANCFSFPFLKPNSSL